MSKMSDKQKQSRAEWRKKMKHLIECTKLPHDHDEYMHPSDLIEEVIDEIPDYDASDSDKRKWLKELGVED